MNFSDNFAERLHGVYFSALKGSIYHSLRADFFRRCWVFSVFITLILGLGSIALASNIFIAPIFPLDKTSFFLASLAFFISFFGFLFNFANKSRFHESLSDRWKDLVKRIADKRGETKGVSAKDCELFIKEHNSIARDELLIYLGLDAVAYNTASRRYGYPRKLKIPLHVHLFNNVHGFLGKEFKEVSKPKANTGK